MRILPWAAVLLVALSLRPSVALACRYNVRDVGFVDLEEASYRAYGLIRDDPADENRSRLREAAAVALADSNVAFEIVNTDQAADHPALSRLPDGSTDSLPGTLLVSPDGQALWSPLAASGPSLRQQAEAALSAMVASPKREEILRTVSSTYAAVLLVEGQSPGENQRARTAIAEAIEQVRSQMQWLPKTISAPPAMIVIDASSRAGERVLLWSLGLDGAPVDQPRAAVLYGRARWIGPLMKGEEISAANLNGILSIIGADCECGLDIGWTQGTRLPVRWPSALHAQLTKALGFDPENPLVKMEVSRIVSRGGSSKAASPGYQELSLEAKPSADHLPPAATAHGKAIPGATATAPPPAAEPVLAETQTVLHRSLLFLGGMAGVIGVVGLLIVVRAALKRRQE